ncbi:SH3 domain-containing protein [Sphingobium sp. B2D3D]|uniref:SH3 domain-containing protein n=1 Tax=unclassified Sphingobium TaxID=2611147 RepID=UPI0039B5A351
MYRLPELGGCSMKSLLLRVARVVVVMTTCAVTSPAGAAYINGTTVNCRAGPDAKASIVAKLRQGQEVSVVEAGAGWSRLATPSCWVSSRFISTSFVAAASSSAQRTRSTAARSSNRRSAGSYSLFNQSAKLSRPKKKRSASSTRRSTGSGVYGGSSCPCSGGTVCIGPRGGRYCITSGGNKRYGV